MNGLSLLGMLIGAACVVAAIVIDGPTWIDRAVAHVRGWLA